MIFPTKQHMMLCRWFGGLNNEIIAFYTYHADADEFGVVDAVVVKLPTAVDEEVLAGLRPLEFGGNSSKVC